MSEYLPHDFNYENLNWKPLSKVLTIRKSSEPKVLGTDGRNYQVKCFKKFNKKNCTIFIAPTGSGKSLVQIFNAAREILDSDYQQKQVFVVPQNNIGKGFTHQKHEKIRINKKVYNWRIEEDCCTDNNESTKRIKKFLLEDVNCDYEKKNQIIGGCTAIVSYSALLRAFEDMSEEQKLKAIQNTSFRPDEIHHICGVDSEVSPNRLGEFCHFVLMNNGSLHLTTATFFRGDRQVIIGNEFIDEFTIYRVPFLDHFENLGLKSLSQNYCAYKNADDLLKQILDSCSKEPNEPPIIILPSDGHAFFDECDKWIWTKKLVNGLGKIFGDKNVLDLVSPDTKFVDKKRLVSDEQDFLAVITCAIGREGTDWQACSRVYNCVLDGNVLQPIQKLGRALRQYNDKTTVKMINYIEYFGDWDNKPEKIRQKLSDRFNAILFASMLDDMLYPKLVKLVPDSNNSNQFDDDFGTEGVSLEDIYGDKRNEIIEELLFQVSALKDRTKESVDIIIDGLISEYEDQILIENIDLNDLKDRLRYEVVIRFDNDPSLRMNGINVDFIREEGWDKVFQQHILNGNLFAGSVDFNDLQILDDFLYKWAIGQSAEKKQQLLQMAKDGEPRPNNKTHPLGKVLSFYTNSKNHGGCYDPVFDEQIRKAAPLWFVDNVIENKKTLLQMAKDGEPRPNQRTHPLGAVLGNYIRETSQCFDKEFYQEIQTIAPHWFIDNLIKESKEQILNIARNGGNKPTGKGHDLGYKLISYLDKNGSGYDPVFEKTLMEIAPTWFVLQSEIAKENKKTLLQMAKNGEPRPNQRTHPLGAVLGNYIRSSSGCYDPEFSMQIKKLRPDWFISQSDRANSQKEQLLQIALNGQERPSGRLGALLSSYTNKGKCYDVEFSEKIRKLASHWFVDTVAEAKQKLLDIAKNKKEKPKQGKLADSKEESYLRGALDRLTKENSKYYDAEFANQLSKLSPHWFIDNVIENKKTLLQMAKNGEPRPNKRKNLLGNLLLNYIRPTSSGYDAEFDKQIRKMAPHWFINTAVENKKKLIEIAKNGEDRPAQRKHQLGSSLTCYTRKKSGSYDEEFTNKIRTLRPDWFKLELA